MGYISPLPHPQPIRQPDTITITDSPRQYPYRRTHHARASPVPAQARRPSLLRAPAGLAAYISANPTTWILLGSYYLLYRAARIRMKRRAQTDDRGCNDDECRCEDDKAGWIGAKEERYRDDPVDAEAHRLRAAHLAKKAYLDRDMNHPFHNTAMLNTTLDNTTPPPDWPSKSHDPTTGVPHVTPPPPPPPTSAPAVIDGRAYTWQEESPPFPSSQLLIWLSPLPLLASTRQLLPFPPHSPSGLPPPQQQSQEGGPIKSPPLGSRL